MTNERKTVFIALAILLAVLTYFLNSTSSAAQKFQAWLGSLYNDAVKLAAALAFFFILGVVLLEAFELPLLVVVAIVVVVSYLAYKAFGWLSSLWNSITGQNSTPGNQSQAPTSSTTPYSNTPMNLYPPGTTFYPDGSYTLPAGSTLGGTDTSGDISDSGDGGSSEDDES